MAIVILATVPQMIACLYTVPRAASRRQAWGQPWQACRGGRVAAARTTAASVEYECAECGAAGTL